VTASVSDADGSSTGNKQFTITVDDDGPSITAPNALFGNEVGTITAAINAAYGADGGALSWTGSSSDGAGILGTYTGKDGNSYTTYLTYNGQALIYVQVDAATWNAVAGGTVVYTVALDSLAKTYSVTMIHELDPILDVAQFRAADAVGAGIATMKLYEDAPTGVSMKVTADTNNSASGGSGNTDQVNTTGEWFGAGSQSIGADDALILQFADNGSWNTTTGAEIAGSYAAAELKSIGFAARALNSGETLEWTAYDAAGNVISGAKWTVVRYDTVDANGQPTGTSINVAAGTAATVTADGESHSGWSIPGSGSGGSNVDYYMLTSDVAFSKIVFEGGASTTFDIGYINVSVVKGSFDITTTLDITATDGDLDTAKDTISLTFSNDGILVGASDVDVLFATSANDTLTGGGGSDVFKWSLSDVGTVGDIATDVIKDFTVGLGGDSLDLRDVLDLNGSASAGQGWTGTINELATQLAPLIRFNQNGSNLELTIDTNGPATDVANTTQGPVQMIVLENVTGSALGGSDMAILTKLLTDGNLKYGDS
jgi:hypothetical protein